MNDTVTAAETTVPTMHRDGHAAGAGLTWAGAGLTWRRPSGERKAALKLLVAEGAYGGWSRRPLHLGEPLGPPFILEEQEKEVVAKTLPGNARVTWCIRAKGPR